jgi:hypothetical protein
MKKLRTTLAGALILAPFLAIAAVNTAGKADQDRAVPVTTASQVCCPFFWMGLWWCVPCS